LKIRFAMLVLSGSARRATVLGLCLIDFSYVPLGNLAKGVRVSRALLCKGWV